MPRSLESDLGSIMGSAWTSPQTSGPQVLSTTFLPQLCDKSPMQCQCPSDVGVVALSSGFRRSSSITCGGGADRPYEDKEETLPKNIRGKDKFEWKLRQLCYVKALEGKKNWGRERKHCVPYATEADGIGEGGIADALRTRDTRHALLEDLALGGFETREFTSLCKTLDETCEYFKDDWPAHSQIKVTVRFIAESATTPKEVLERWDVFIDRSCF